MSKYTTQVRFICETASGLTESAGFNSVNEIIQSAIPNVFNFDFPIYDEDYRNVLCTKILKHYYTREIGAETVGLWKLWLDTRLNEIMPYYNQLYKSAVIEFDPMYDIDLTTTHTKNNNGVTSVEGESDSNTENSNSQTKKLNGNDSAESNTTQVSNVNKENSSHGSYELSKTASSDKAQRDLFSDTPQGSLENVENETYLTNARKITDNTTTTEEGSSSYNNSDTSKENGNSTSNYSGSNTISRNEENSETSTSTFGSTNSSETSIYNTEEYIQKIVGKSGGSSYSKRLQEFRNTFLNIDCMIIGELTDLFINLW